MPNFAELLAILPTVGHLADTLQCHLDLVRVEQLLGLTLTSG